MSHQAAWTDARANTPLITGTDAGRDSESPCRVLSLDGGGAKGLYTLGVLKEMEAMAGMPFYQGFDLIVGTGTGSIIAALLALGYPVEETCRLFKEHVPTVIRQKNPRDRSAALTCLVDTVFGDRTFPDFKTGVGIVATRLEFETPMIFRTKMAKARGRLGTCLPGFGCTVADAVQASCSAYPLFLPHTVKTGNADLIELVDGRQCASNPALFAVAAAAIDCRRAPADLRLVSIGVGVFPERKRWRLWPWPWPTRRGSAGALLQKLWNVNTCCTEYLSSVLLNDAWTVRINDTFGSPELATDLAESDPSKLDLLYQRGADSFAHRAAEIQRMIFCENEVEPLPYGELADGRSYVATRTPDRLVG